MMMISRGKEERKGEEVGVCDDVMFASSGQTGGGDSVSHLSSSEVARGRHGGEERRGDVKRFVGEP